MKVNWLKSIKFVAISLIPTVFGLLFATAHSVDGDLLTAKILFPYAILLLIILPVETYLFSLIVAFLQIPIYAFILSRVEKGNRVFGTALLILAFHFSAVILCFIFFSLRFP